MDRRFETMKNLSLKESISCHLSLKTGARLVGWGSLIFSYILLVKEVVEQAVTFEKIAEDDIEDFMIKCFLKFALIFLFIGVSFMNLIGLYAEKPQYILPWLVVFTTAKMYFFGSSIKEIIFTAQDGFSRHCVISALISAVVSAINLSLICIVYSYYVKLRKKPTKTCLFL